MPRRSIRGREITGRLFRFTQEAPLFYGMTGDLIGFMRCSGREP
jgi:hypothetical protein